MFASKVFVDCLSTRCRVFASSVRVASCVRGSDWEAAVARAERLVGYPTSLLSLRYLLGDEFGNVALRARRLAASQHPLLRTARRFVNDSNHSLQARSLIVLLVSKAAGQGSKPDPEPGSGENNDLDSVPDPEEMVSGIYPRQRSLAEITELIHMAFVLHGGIVPLGSECKPQDDMHFGNKMAVLTGDILLASACTNLARLHNGKVVELMSSAIGDLVQGSFPGVELQSDLQQFTEGGSESVGILQSAPLVLLRQSMDFETWRELLKAATHKGHVDYQQLCSTTGLQDVLHEVTQLCHHHGDLALQALQAFPESEARIALETLVYTLTPSELSQPELP
uniref:all trans-polyprenyl-diphosphate synthase PDSS2 isoform X2 n=1 Tax=Myxine glutinosa TaxID=7769 RepID=UPI00358FD853